MEQWEISIRSIVTTIYTLVRHSIILSCVCVQVLDNQCDECRATLVVIVVDDNGNVVACEHFFFPQLNHSNFIIEKIISL